MKHFPHDQHVYLAGPIEGLSYKESTEWRDAATLTLNSLDIDTLDPTRRVSFVDDQSEHASARIWKSDLQDISHSSVILANLSDALPGKKWGTVAEIAHAHTKNKIIIVLLEENQFKHPFIMQYATEVHYNLNSAIYAVREYFR
jgi:nucleoside 2-deoxyribosyltransferase